MKCNKSARIPQIKTKWLTAYESEDFTGRGPQFLLLSWNIWFSIHTQKSKGKYKHYNNFSQILPSNIKFFIIYS